MQRIYLIFDYFSEAFHINRRNKKIYLPQIIFIIIKTLLTLAVGMLFYIWFENGVFHSLREVFTLRQILPNLVNLLLVLIVYSLLSIVFETGMYNMYKSCVFGQGLVEGDFWQGVKKYYLKFLSINLLIIVGSLIVLPILIIMGLVTLFIGFILIPIMIMIAIIFITYWKISLVVNDTRVYQGLKDSFNFLKNCFIPISLIQIIHFAFSGGVNLQSRASLNASINSVASIHDIFNNTPVPYFDINFIKDTISVIFAILLPVITILTIISSLIKMLFEVFFSLSLFVAYKNNFNIVYTTIKEVPHDVV